MEFLELQSMWQQHDKILSENTKINKEVLKRILISKSEKRINWEKVKAGVNLILPIVLILLLLVPNIHYRSSADFYIGLFMFGGVSMVIYYWSARYFMLINKVDFSSSITLIKKNIKQLEKYKVKLKKVGYILMPFGITGVFLLVEFPLFSRESFLPIFLIILVMIISIYYTFKISLFEQFRKLNKEIEEVENMEKE
ncbi:MAG: hypothetical protein ACERIH_10095 [Labilibaculum antarcticum]